MKTAIGGLSLAGLWMFSAPVFGVTWSGYSTALPGTSAAARPELAGSVVARQRYSLPSEPLDPSSPRVTLDTWVVRESSSGDLDFYFQYSNPNNVVATIPSPTLLTGFDIGPALDVDFRTDLGGEATIGAFAAERANVTGDGLYVSAFRYGVWPLDPQASLLPVFIHTSATEFQSTGLIQLSSYEISGTAFVPATSVGAVPEPSTLLLLPLGLGALAIRRPR